MALSHRFATIFLVAAPTAAGAQANQQPSSHVEAGQPAKPHADEPKQKHLLGDWNKALSDKGIDLSLGYEGDLGVAISVIF